MRLGFKIMFSPEASSNRGLSDNRSASCWEGDRSRQGVQIEHFGPTTVVCRASGSRDLPICCECADAAIAIVLAGLGSNQRGHCGALEVKIGTSVALVVVFEEEVWHFSC